MAITRSKRQCQVSPGWGLFHSPILMIIYISHLNSLQISWLSHPLLFLFLHVSVETMMILGGVHLHPVPLVVLLPLIHYHQVPHAHWIDASPPSPCWPWLTNTTSCPWLSPSCLPLPCRRSCWRCPCLSRPENYKYFDQQ